MDLFHNTLGPAAWIAVGLVPPAIFALYFLKLKRQPLEVPSTYLWTKVIEDLHVNSLWQRLRQNLLMFLQLAIALMAILALLRPGWQGQALTGRQFIFLIDRSASMSTKDADGGTRLDAAKKRLTALVDQMDSDMSAMIIAFDSEPDVIQEFSDNRRELREAIARIEPTAKRTEIRGALELASGFANPQRVAIEEGGAEVDATPQEKVSMFILSDGRFDAVADFSLGNLEAQYLPIGSPVSANLAITALTAARNPAALEQRQAFVQVANFSAADQKTIVNLSRDGELVDAMELTVPAGDVAGATFDLGDADSGKLTAKIQSSSAVDDRLALDDVAYAVLDPSEQSRVLLVTPGNRALELGLSTEEVLRLAKVEKISPASLGTDDFRRQMESGAYDVVIFDQCAPATTADMPEASTLFIGRIPPLPLWKAKASDKPLAGPQIIDWQRGHPLMSLVELGNVAIADSYTVPPPAGGMVLVDSTIGPIAAIAPRGNYEDAVLGFEIVAQNDAGETTVNTNWPRRHSFPNFCLNVVEYLAGASAASQMAAHFPGEPVELDLGADKLANLRVTLPDGATRPVPRPDSGKAAVLETDQPGVYEVDAAGTPVAKFVVNLFDRQESDVAVRARQRDAKGLQEVDALSIGYTAVAASATAPARKELWTAILLAALAVLVLEWYIYNRRVYV